MSKIVYTLNGKVLKNSANDKWLQKKEPFVMNASNATFTRSGSSNSYVSWEGPAYPDNYDGGGKQYIIVNNNSAEVITDMIQSQLMYSNVINGGGPDAIKLANMRISGTSTGTLSANPVPSMFGKYLIMNLRGTEEQINAYVANLTITIM